jgi:catechol 2,3-dioxygenase-like lactoylglutathione lyase family enzyme
MFATPRIHLVTLGVTDLAASTAFYTRRGLTPSAASQEAVTFFQLGPVVLGLFGREALAEDAHVSSFRPGSGAVTLAWNQPSEASVDSAYAAALAAGATAVKAPEKVFWGGYSSYVADPDGHLWEIAYNPLFPFDNTGALTLP